MGGDEKNSFMPGRVRDVYRQTSVSQAAGYVPLMSDAHHPNNAHKG